MSKEQEFRKLVQEQDIEEKNKLWERIERQTDDEEIIELGEVLRKKRVFTKKNIAIIASFAVIIAAMTTILLCTLLPKQTDINRYCVAGDYYSVETETTIAQYSQENNIELLYFDWFEDYGFYSDIQYRLNSTDEIICLREEAIDENYKYITLYISDINTSIDFLNVYYTACDSTATIGSVEVKYGISVDVTYAFVNYNNYNYYLVADRVANAEYILNIVEGLLR